MIKAKTDVQALKQNLANLNEHEKGDFVNDDGLICCGKCGKPKQFMAGKYRSGKIPKVLMFDDDLIPCLCDCNKDDRAAQDALRAKVRKLSKEDRKRCFVDSKYANCFFESTEDRSKAVKYCRNYAEHLFDIVPNSTGLLFYGPVGAGKTHLASCIANEALDKGYNVCFTSLSKICEAITLEYGTTSYVLDKLCRNQIVVIDDLGIERNDEKTLQRVYLTINELYEKGVVMLITTNLPLSEIQNPKSAELQRIYSRILGVCVPIEVLGTDDRKTGTERIKRDAVKALMKG